MTGLNVHAGGFEGGGTSVDNAPPAQFGGGVYVWPSIDPFTEPFEEDEGGRMARVTDGMEDWPLDGFNGTQQTSEGFESGGNW